MDREAILNELVSGIVSINITIKREDIDQERGLLESGVLDSYGFVEFIGFIEQAFRLTLDDSDINQKNFQNLIALTEMIESKLSK